MKNDKIDFIFPYVDNCDPNWQDLYNKTLNIRKDDDKLPLNLATGEERFRSNGLLKYVFRSIDKHLPWINKVHMIVQSDSQVPEWINRDEVNIVYHEDFIPKEYLPTFNSGTIEMFLHRIEALSEKFIYGNDDMFINHDFKSSNFFSNELPIFGIKIRNVNYKWIWDTTLRLNNQKLLNMPTTIIYDVQHTVLPYTKTIINEVFETCKNEILNSISPFRLSKNYNQWLFALYCYKNNKFINRKHTYIKCASSNVALSKLYRNWNNYKTICINDNKNINIELSEKFIELFESHFPEKSKYEL